MTENIPYDPNNPALIQNSTNLSSTGRNYIQNLYLISQDLIDNVDDFPSATSNPLFTTLAELGAGLHIINNYGQLSPFFDSFNASEGHPLPDTWDEFLESFLSFYGGGLNSGYTPTNNPIYDAFKTNFMRMSGSQTDWNNIVSSTEVDEDAQFQAAFSAFLRSFPYGPDGTINSLASANSSALFFRTLFRFFVPVSVTNTGTSTNYQTDLDNTPVSDTLIAQYDRLYQYFVPDGNQTSFQAEFRDYYFSEVNRVGYFHAGQALDGWVTRLWDEFASTRDRPSRTVTLGDDLVIAPSYNAPALEEANNSHCIEISVVIDPANPNDVLNFTYSGQVILNGQKFLMSRNSPTNINIVKEAPTNGDPLIPFTSEEALQLIRLVSYQNLNPATNTSPKKAVVSYTNGFFDDVALTDIEFTPEPLVGTFQTTVTSVSNESSKRLLVLDRIFQLLASILGSLQSVAAAQAQQLTFLSNWQRAFTDKIALIETFTRNDNSIFGQVSATSATDDATFASDRGDANQAQVNRRETLSAYRNIVQDTAKREQTRINQSQDAVSQQASMASTIIQELTTILGVIFK